MSDSVFFSYLTLIESVSQLTMDGLESGLVAMFDQIRVYETV